jgi:MFS family permease
MPPTPSTDPTTFERARAARFAVSTVFLVNGAIGATILPRLPAIKDGLALTNAELGTAVAAMPVGGLLAGGFAGLLIARFGSGRVATIAGALTALMLLGIGFAGSWAMLALAYLVMGMFDSTMDAAMNAHGLGVQRRYGRSILQGFHGMWSAGNMAAAAVGAALAFAGVPVAIHLAVAAVVLSITVAVAGTRMLPAAVADAPDPGAINDPVHARMLPRLLRILAPIAMLGILCAILQSAAQVWSAVYLADVLLAPAGIAASAFVLYMAAMVVGRLTNDRWVDRWGSIAVVRGGAIIGAAGVLLAIVASPLGSVPLAFVGFALVGFGSSSMFPVMIAAAGSRPGIAAGHGIAICTWLVRSGLVFAPAIIGAAADEWGLAAAFGIPLAAGVLIAVVTPIFTGAPLRRAVAATPGAAAS